MSDRILNIDRISTARTEAGYSQRALSEEIGQNPSLVSLLEKDKHHRDLTVRQLDRLANAIGLEIADLFLRRDGTATPPPVSPSDAIVEAVLATTSSPAPAETIASVLGWTLTETRDALRALGARLQGTGTMLNRTNVGYKLTPRRLLSDDELARLTRLQLATRKIKVSALQLLRQAIREPLDMEWQRRAGNSDRVNSGILLNAGLLVRTSKGALEPSNDVRRSVDAILG